MPDMSSDTPQPSRLVRFLKYHLPLILYAGLILAVSSIPNLHPPRLRWLPSDKVAHFCEYAILALLAFRSFSNIGARTPILRAALVSGLFLSLFALLDETYQKMIPGRHFDLMDYAVDLLGGLLVLLILSFRRQRRSATIR